MDRRALLGKSKAELVMARVGQVMAACYLLLLLPVVLAYVAGPEGAGPVHRRVRPATPVRTQNRHAVVLTRRPLFDAAEATSAADVSGVFAAAVNRTYGP